MRSGGGKAKVNVTANYQRTIWLGLVRHALARDLPFPSGDLFSFFSHVLYYPRQITNWLKSKIL